MSTGYDGSIRINTKIDTKDGEKKVSSLGDKFKSLGKIVAAAFAITKLVQFGKQAISLSSDLAEVQNVVNVSFGSMADKANDFAKSALKNFGLSELSAKRYSSTFMSMAKSMGLSMENAADMSLDLAGLVGDVSSFYNISQDIAAGKLKGIFTGESESLKDLGVVMTQTNLESYALEKGIAKSLDAMTQAEKVTLRYQYVTEQLALAQGDFARTSNGWANQIRVLQETIKSIMTICGDFLINYLTPIVNRLNDMLQGILAVAQAAKQLFLVGDAAEQMSTATEKSAEAQDGVTASIEGTGEAIEGNLASFDELNIMNDAAGNTAVGETETLIGGSDAAITVGEESEVSSDLVAVADKIKGVIAPALTLLKTLATDGAAALKEIWANVLSPMFNFLVPAIKKLIEGLTTLYEAVIKPLVQIFGAKLLPVYKQFYEAMADNIEGANSFGDFVSKSLETVGNAAKSLLDALVELFPQVLDIGLKVVKNLVKGITDALPSIVKAAGDMVKTLISAIVDNLPMIIETALTIIFALVDTLLDNLPLIIETAIDLILALIEGILQCLPQIIEAAIQLVIGLAQGIMDALPHLLEAATQIIGRLWDTIMSTDWLELGKNILLAIINGIGSLITNGVEMMKNFVTSIVNVFKNTNWLEVGKNILKGIGNGIKNAVTGVVDMAKNACKSIWNGIKSFFGIHSPSTLMRDTVGNNIALGIGEGFEGEINGVADNMEKALADELDTSWSSLADELAGVSLPDIGLKELLPVQVSSEIIKSDDNETFEEIRDDVAEIARNVEELKNKKDNGSTVQSGGFTTRNGETIDPRRENRKAGKTIYPVGT